MDDPRSEELRRRIEALERDRRRWKVIGITSLAVLGLGLCLGCPLSLGTALVRARYMRAIEAEREAAERQRQEAETARQEAERREKQARQEAERREKEAEQKTRVFQPGD